MAGNFSGFGGFAALCPWQQGVEGGQPHVDSRGNFGQNQSEVAREKLQIQELKRKMQEHKERHKKELDSKTEEVRTFANQLKQEEQKTEEWKQSAEYHRKSFESLRDNYNEATKTWHEEVQQLQTRLSKKEEESQVLQEELRDKRARLASRFEKRLKQDQRRVENTAEMNTPSEIEKDFKTFFDGERIDACDVIESKLHSSEKKDVEIYYPRLACLIFVTAYEEVKEARDAAYDLFQSVANQLIEEAPRTGQELCLTRKVRRRTPPCLNSL